MCFSCQVSDSSNSAALHLARSCDCRCMVDRSGIASDDMPSESATLLARYVDRMLGFEGSIRGMLLVTAPRISIFQAFPRARFNLS